MEPQKTFRPWLSHYPSAVECNLFSNPETLVHMLKKTVMRFPDHAALHFMGTDVSYRKLQTYAEQLSYRLSCMGIKKGDRVALLLPNCPQWSISYYAILMLGAIVVPYNPLYTETELIGKIKDAAPTTIITLDLFYPKVKNIKHMIANESVLENIIVAAIPEFLPTVTSLIYPTVYRWKLQSAIKKASDQKKISLQEKLDLFEEGRRAVAKDKKEIFLFKKLVAKPLDNAERTILNVLRPTPFDTGALPYTGGTTGTSKGAMLSHANLWSNARQVASWFFDAQPGNERFLGALPLSHMFASTVTQNTCFMLGGTLVLIPDATDIDYVTKMIAAQKITVIAGVPRLFDALIARCKNGELQSVKRCISGGAKASSTTLERFEALAPGTLIEGFGLTEASPVTHANPLSGLRKAGSIGIPLPGTNAKIMVRECSGYREAAIGEEGELWIQGPQVMRGYWKAVTETANVFFEDGSGVWLMTGDIAIMDEDGYFFIRDRVKNMILTDSGFNIYPNEVENVLRLHSAIAEAAAVGIPVEGKEGKEIHTVFVVLVPGASITKEALIAHCRKHLAPYKIPKHVEFRLELPISMEGKTLHRVLRDEMTALRAKIK